MSITTEEISGTLMIVRGKYGPVVSVMFKEAAGPSSYSAGGFAVTVGDLNKVLNAVPWATGGYVPSIDWPNSSGNELQIIIYSGGSEVAAGTDLSGETVTILGFGE